MSAAEIEHERCPDCAHLPWDDARSYCVCPPDSAKFARMALAYPPPDDIPPEHVIIDRVVLPTAAHEAVVELVNNPPPPTPALVACMAPPEEPPPDALDEAVNLFDAMLKDRAHGNRCRSTAPAVFAQAGAQCEREPHPTPNHKVSPRDGLPGAVWSDARSREDGGS